MPLTHQFISQLCKGCASAMGGCLPCGDLENPGSSILGPCCLLNSAREKEREPGGSSLTSESLGSEVTFITSVPIPLARAGHMATPGYREGWDMLPLLGSHLSAPHTCESWIWLTNKYLGHDHLLRKALPNHLTQGIFLLFLSIQYPNFILFRVHFIYLLVYCLFPHLEGKSVGGGNLGQCHIPGTSIRVWSIDNIS